MLQTQNSRNMPSISEESFTFFWFKQILLKSWENKLHNVCDKPFHSFTNLIFNFYFRKYHVARRPGWMIIFLTWLHGGREMDCWASYIDFEPEREHCGQSVLFSCVLNVFTPVLRAVQLWLDHLGPTLLPCLNRASVFISKPVLLSLLLLHFRQWNELLSTPIFISPVSPELRDTHVRWIRAGK